MRLEAIAVQNKNIRMLDEVANVVSKYALVAVLLANQTTDL